MNTIRNAISKLQRTVVVLRKVEALYVMLNHHEADIQRSGSIHCEMANRNLLPHNGDPTKELGTALKLAQEYNLVLGGGITGCYGSAVLLEKYWGKPIKDDVKSSEFGSFLDDEPHDEIHSIGAMSPKIQFAICTCLIYADIAGVLCRL